MGFFDPFSELELTSLFLYAFFTLAALLLFLKKPRYSHWGIPFFILNNSVTLFFLPFSLSRYRFGEIPAPYLPLIVTVAGLFCAIGFRGFGRLRASAIAMASFLGIVTIQSLFVASSYLSVFLYGVIWVVSLSGMFLGAEFTARSNPDSMKRYFKCLAGVITFACVVGFIRYAVDVNNMFGNFYINEVNPFAMLNKNVAVQVFCLAFPLIMSLRDCESLPKWQEVGMFLLLSVFIIMNGSRVNMLIMAFSTLFYLILFAVTFRNKISPLKILLRGVMICTIWGILFAGLSYHNKNAKRLSNKIASIPSAAKTLIFENVSKIETPSVNPPSAPPETVSNEKSPPARQSAGNLKETNIDSEKHVKTEGAGASKTKTLQVTPTLPEPHPEAPPDAGTPLKIESLKKTHRDYRRVLYLRAGVNVTRKYWLFGTGLGTKNYLEAMKTVKNYGRAKKPHCFYVTAIGEYGIFGFAAVFTLFVSVCVRFEMFRRSDEIDDASKILVLAFESYALSFFLSLLTHDGAFFPFAWIVIGFGLGIGSWKRTTGSSTNEINRENNNI